MDLQKALNLFRQAYEEDRSILGEYMLDHLILLHRFRELQKRGNTAEIQRILDNPDWSSRSRLALSISHFSSPDPSLLDWIRYFHYQKGCPKEEIMRLLSDSSSPLVRNNHDSEKQLYFVALSCLAEMGR